MKTKPTLTLDDARRMAAAGEAEARKHQWNVVIAVCDDGGPPILLPRLDGVGPRRKRPEEQGGEGEGGPGHVHLRGGSDSRQYRRSMVATAPVPTVPSARS